MTEKPSRWEYITTIIILLLCAAWAWNDYKNDPTKIPFEPLIAVVSSLFILWSFVRWKKGKDEREQAALKVKQKNVVKQSTITSGGGVTIGDSTNNIHQKNTGSGDNIARDKVEGDKIEGNKIINEYKYYGENKIKRILTNRPFNSDCAGTLDFTSTAHFSPSGPSTMKSTS